MIDSFGPSSGGGRHRCGMDGIGTGVEEGASPVLERGTGGDHVVDQQHPPPDRPTSHERDTTEALDATETAL